MSTLNSEVSVQEDWPTARRGTDQDLLNWRGIVARFFRALGVPPWGYVFAVATVAVATFLYSHIGTVESNLTNRLDNASTISNDINTRLSRVEGQLSVLIGRSYLAEAEKEVKGANLATASKQLASAVGLFTQAMNSGIAVPADFFSTALDSVDRIESASSDPTLQEAAFKARMALALYSSRLRPLPSLPTNRPLTVKGTVNLTPDNGATFSGRLIIWTGSSPPKDFFKPPFSTIVARASSTLTDVAMKDGAQTLDGITWINVVFINCNIKWTGGQTFLQNVVFVNCRFSVTQPAGRKLLDYAVRGGTMTLG
jgi:hypothetical protein